MRDEREDCDLREEMSDAAKRTAHSGSVGGRGDSAAERVSVVGGRGDMKRSCIGDSGAERQRQGVIH
jgi:hypothetical protein